MSAVETHVLSNRELAIKTLVDICERGAAPRDRLTAAHTLMNNNEELITVQQTFRQIASVVCFESSEAAGLLLLFEQRHGSKE